ncbi:tryptophan synthase alpha chain [Clostridia bacterium]|nr:tryptophan synthase alpha chain [Clostridia bacterium]
MSKISEAFKSGKAFIPYLMAGDPALDKTREYILAMEKAGADIIEIGIPFSDPIAEGDTIQKANLRAFASGTSLDGIFEMAASLKGEIKIPLLFMTYINPVFNYGRDEFFSRCAECGVSGIIIPDVPFEEREEVLAYTEKHGVELITLIAPTSPAERIGRIAGPARGYIYLVSSMGVTGVRSEISTDIAPIVAEIRRNTDIPVAIGFGISSPEQAREMAAEADGVIVGSAIVNLLEQYGGDAAGHVAEYVRSMKEALLYSNSL